MPASETFSHVATFYSLIVGMAVANVLGVAAKATKTDARVRWYWLHTSTAALLLLMIAQDWWFLLSWDRGEFVTHAVLVFLLAKAGVLYFASNILAPEPSDSRNAELDLREHMLRVRRRFFLALAAFPVLDTIDTLLKGRERLDSLGPAYPIYVAAAFLLFILAALARTERPAGRIVIVLLLVHVGIIVGGALGVLQ